MRTIIVMLVACAAVAMAREIEIDGENLSVSGGATICQPFVEITALSAYRATLVGKRTERTVLAGTVVCRLVHANHIVTIEIMVRNSRPGLSGTGFRIPFTVTIERPPIDRPVHFTAVGLPWYTPTAAGKQDPRDRPVFDYTFQVHLWTPERAANVQAPKIP